MWFGDFLLMFYSLWFFCEGYFEWEWWKFIWIFHFGLFFSSNTCAVYMFAFLLKKQMLSLTCLLFCSESKCCAMCLMLKLTCTLWLGTWFGCFVESGGPLLCHFGLFHFRVGNQNCFLFLCFQFSFCFPVWFGFVAWLDCEKKGIVLLLIVFVFGLFPVCMCVTFCGWF